MSKYNIILHRYKTHNFFQNKAMITQKICLIGAKICDTLYPDIDIIKKKI